MKTVSGMGRFPATIELKNEAEQCGTSHYVQIKSMPDSFCRTIEYGLKYVHFWA
jgi:hypothetical protein